MAFKHAKVGKPEEIQLGQDRPGQEKISSDDDLWRAVGKDFDEGFENLAGKTGIPRERLIEILGDCAVREPDATTPGWLAWPSRHALDLLVLLTALFLTFLCLRAGGGLSRWPAPWGLTERIPVTAKELSKDQTLRAGDLVEAWLNPQPGQFRDLRDVQGFRLATDLSAGSPIRFADVMREQVIALRDIPRGSGVPANAVASHWSSYHPDAILDPQKVIGRQALSSIRKGEVIAMGELGP